MADSHLVTFEDSYGYRYFGWADGTTSSERLVIEGCYSLEVEDIESETHYEETVEECSKEEFIKFLENADSEVTQEHKEKLMEVFF